MENLFSCVRGLPAQTRSWCCPPERNKVLPATLREREGMTPPLCRDLLYFLLISSRTKEYGNVHITSYLIVTSLSLELILIFLP